MNTNLKQRATQMINQPTMRMIQRRKELLGRRGLKKQAPIMTYPKVIEKKYQVELINFVNVIAKEINLRLIDNLEQIERQKNIELNLDSWVDSVDDIMESLKVWGMAKASEMLAVITLKASQIGDWNTKQFKQSIKTVVGVDPISKNQGYQTLIQSWSKENSRLITSIQANLLDDVAGVTQRGMSAGKSINDISKEIKDRFGVTKSRARTIARTETAKLNSNLTKVRNQELGIKTYTWVTANDGERVRPSHRELHNLLCSWSDDTICSRDNGKTWIKRKSIGAFVGKPGDDINCRCTSRSNVNQLLEELGI
jgi:SPP1 gp7 family putative phage head morphogenesis protein